MKRLGILFIVIIFLFPSCSWLQKKTIDLSEIHVENMKALGKVADNLNSVWPLVSGVTERVIENNKDEMNAANLEAFRALIQRRDQYIDPETGEPKKDLTMKEKGLILGDAAEFVELVAKESLDALKWWVDFVKGIVPGL